MRFISYVYDESESGVMLVESEDAEKISGKTIYTSSAYGSAVLDDELECGREVTLDKKSLTEIQEITEPDRVAYYKERLENGLKERAVYAKDFKPSSKSRVQVIEIAKDRFSYAFSFIQTYPEENPPADGVPMTQRWVVRIKNEEDFEKIKKDPFFVEKDRFDRLSTSGLIFDDTKVYLGDQYLGEFANLCSHLSYMFSISNRDERIIGGLIKTLCEIETIERSQDESDQ